MAADVDLRTLPVTLLTRPGGGDPHGFDDLRYRSPGARLASMIAMWQWRRGIHHAVTSFIDEGSALEGKCSFPGTLMLNGRLTGELESTGTLIVGASAVLQAGIHARVVIVRGEVVGNIVAAERIELKAGARVFGDLETPVLLVEEGALIEGKTRMTPESRTGGARTA